MDTAGIVLAGGASRRMGSDKARLEIGGSTFLERIRRTLGRVVGEIVVAAGDPRRYPETGGRVIGDAFPGCGPLAGIHAGLAAIGADRALVVSCDMPLVTVEACRSLLQAAGSSDVVVARCEGKVQPLFGVYQKRILPELEAALRQGRYSVLDFLGTMDSEAVELEFSSGVRNINTPEDYEAVLASRPV